MKGTPTPKAPQHARPGLLCGQYPTQAEQSEPTPPTEAQLRDRAQRQVLQPFRRAFSGDWRTFARLQMAAVDRMSIDAETVTAAQHECDRRMIVATPARLSQITGLKIGRVRRVLEAS